MHPFAKLFEHPQLGQILLQIDTQELEGYGDAPCLRVTIDPNIDGVALVSSAVFIPEAESMRDVLDTFDEESAVALAWQIRRRVQQTGEVGELRA